MTDITTLHEFVPYVTSAIGEVEQDLPDATALFCVDDGDAILVAAFDDDDPESRVLAEVDQILPNRKLAALVSLASWAPDQVSPTMPTWVVTAVEKGEAPAMFFLRQRGTTKWYQLAPDQMPWFALSTAGSLRKALVSGEPLTLRNASGNPSLFNNPFDGNPPPRERKDGKI